jgi:hypothetical protein
MNQQHSTRAMSFFCGLFAHYLKINFLTSKLIFNLTCYYEFEKITLTEAMASDVDDAYGEQPGSGSVLCIKRNQPR